MPAAAGSDASVDATGMLAPPLGALTRTGARRLQEEGIKSAADIRTLSEDDMMDMGMNIGQRNRVFNWVRRASVLPALPSLACHARLASAETQARSCARDV